MSGRAGPKELRGLLRSVEQYGIAPLTRIQVTRPRDLAGRGWSDFTARRAEVERTAAEKLQVLGARISTRWDAAEITLGGLTARSSCGLLQALKNWRTQVQNVKFDGRKA